MENQEINLEESKETVSEVLSEPEYPNSDMSIDKIIKILNNTNGISLDMTIEMMMSPDYRIRFIAEYIQCKIRYNSLHQMIVKMDAGTLGFIPDCPRDILAAQKASMGCYLNQLEIRAEIEKIPLPRV